MPLGGAAPGIRRARRGRASVTRLERVDASRRYAVETYPDDIRLVAEPFVEPFHRCNVRHVRGAKDALIENTYQANAAERVRSMRRLLDFPVRVVRGGHFPGCGRGRRRAIVRAWLDAH